MKVTAEQHHALYTVMLRTIAEFMESPEVREGPLWMRILAGDCTAAAANFFEDDMLADDYSPFVGIREEE